MYAIGKGTVKALLVFTLPAFLVITFYDDIADKWNGISELPVVRQFKKDFKSGTELFGSTFAKELQLYYADTTFQLTLDEPPAPAQATATRHYWHRDQMQSMLIGSMPRGYHANIMAYLDYVEQYRDIAVADMRRTKIPASVTLAQGLLESNAGRSRLARQANNHFGIKCRTRPGFRRDGRISDEDFYPSSLAVDCLQAHDDYAWDRFEVYPSARESFRRHSMLLHEPRYAWMLRKYEIGGYYEAPRRFYGHQEVPYYAAWSIGLKSSGYATASVYAEKLTLIIETYHLWKIDYEALRGGGE